MGKDSILATEQDRLELLFLHLPDEEKDWEQLRLCLFIAVDEDLPHEAECLNWILSGQYHPLYTHSDDSYWLNRKAYVWYPYDPIHPDHEFRLSKLLMDRMFLGYRNEDNWWRDYKTVHEAYADLLRAWRLCRKQGVDPNTIPEEE
jgi:hypothetical protein